MKKKKIYQTLQDKDNPDYIEQHAPFKCNRKNAWLGEGYYFWDTFIEIAHWWGENSYNKSYVICEGTCNFDTDKCLDLVGNTEQLLEFDQAVEFLKSKKLVDKNTTVARILNFLRYKIEGFKYEAIRAYGINSISKNNQNNHKYIFRLSFKPASFQYLDYKPAIQICIFKKKSMGLSNMEIVYPNKYVIDI